MKSFQQWKNEKQYFELANNPNAVPVPVPPPSPTFRGVPPVVNPATAPAPNTTANPTNSTTNNATANQPDKAIEAKHKRIMDVFRTSSPQQQAALLDAIEASVSQSLAAAGKTSLFKQVARGNIQDGRAMLRGGVQAFSTNN